MTGLMAPPVSPVAAPARTKEIPPDLAAVLRDAPVHPSLLRPAHAAPSPTAATLTGAALSLAAHAALHDTVRGESSWSAVPDPGLPAGTRGLVHRVGSGGVLHLAPAAGPRAVAVATGVLDQRGGAHPRLTPGVVRLVPPGRSLTLADLGGSGAIAVEVGL